MVKLGAPSKDTALGLGSLPDCVREPISLEEAGSPAPVSQDGWLKETLALTYSLITGPMRHGRGERNCLRYIMYQWQVRIHPHS